MAAAFLVPCRGGAEEIDSQKASILGELAPIAGVQGKAKAYIKKAQEYDAQKKYRQATDAYTEALAAGPNKKTKFEVYLRLGELELRRMQYASAIEYLKTAAELYPKDEETHVRLARAYEESDLKGFAEKEYLKVLKYRKKSFDASFGLALLYYEEGFYTKAMSNFNKALDVNASLDVYRKTAACARKLNDVDLALSILKQVVLAGPVYEDYISMGEIYELKTRPAEAEKSYSLAMAADPGKKDSYLRLGVMYIDLGRFSDAEKVLKLSSSIKPVSGLDHFFLGVLYSKTGRPALAKSEMKEAGKLLDSVVIRNFIAFLSK